MKARALKKDEHATHKLHARWIGPFRITQQISNWVYEIEDLLNNNPVTNREIVHASRLKFYHDASLNVNTELIDQMTRDRGDVTYEQLLNHRYDRGDARWEILVKWIGLEDVENSWEPATTVYTNNKNMYRTYVTGIQDLALQRTLRDIVGIRTRGNGANNADN